MKKNWKMITIPIAAFILCFLLGGCFPSHQLNETAIVQAIGIDWNLETQEYDLTLQIYSPKGAGASTAIDTSKNNANIITTSGRTIASALRDATIHQGKTIFSGNNRIIVIGRSLAEQGLEELFSYFNRDPLTRQNVPVVMADREAREIVSTDIEQGILAAETIKNILDNSSENGYVYTSPYYLLAKNMKLYGGCGAVPVVSFDNEQENVESGSEETQATEEIPDVTNLQIRHTAVFKDYRWVGDLDESQTRGLVALSGQMNKTILVPEQNQTLYSVGIYQCKAHLEPIINEDKTISFRLKLKAKASLEEQSSPEGISLEELQQVCEKLIEQEVQSAFSAVVNQYGTDILYLGDLVVKEDRNFWKEQQQQFSDHFSQMKLDTEIDVVIDRIGMEIKT